jgi:hypothetical protein
MCRLDSQDMQSDRDQSIATQPPELLEMLEPRAHAPKHEAIYIRIGQKLNSPSPKR